MRLAGAAVGVVLLLCAVCVIAECAVHPTTPRTRPTYHFLPPDGHWINDPCAPFFDPTTRLYHVFYQTNPNASVWGDMHWGHTVSPDLVHWSARPMALAPDTPYDAAGVFTGSAAWVSPTSLAVLYTGVQAGVPLAVAESVAVARPANLSDPFLTHWVKPKDNPIVPPMPLPSVLGKATAFRDPTEILSPRGSPAPFFVMGAGALVQDPLAPDSGADVGLGMALRYKVSGPESVAEVGFWDVLLSANSTLDDGDIWECPDPFMVPGSVTAVLKVSSRAQGYGDHWYLGSSLVPETPFGTFAHDVVDYGQVYASKSFLDPVSGSRIQLGWASEGDSQASQVARGWAGVHIIPRVVSLVDDAHSSRLLLSALPLANLNELHQQGSRAAIDAPVALPVSGTTALPKGFSGATQDVLLKFHVPGGAGPAPPPPPPGVGPSIMGIAVRASPDGSEVTRIGVVLRAPDAGFPGAVFLDATPVLVNATVIKPAACQALCRSRPLCHGWTASPAHGCAIYSQTGVPALVGSAANASVVSGWGSLMFVDRTHTSLAPDQDTSPNSGALPLPVQSFVPPADLSIDLRVLLDNSIIEVFANSGTARSASRIYPTLTASTGMHIFSDNVPPGTTLTAAETWSMTDIWHE